MTTATMPDLFAAARHRGGAVGAFNVILVEHAEALVEGAERAELPVVLQISQNCVHYHGALAPLASAVLSIARQAVVPVVVHLDHADDERLVHEAVDLGITSVMFDASALPYDENVSSTGRVVQWCHRRGAVVEAELGEVGGKDGVHAAGVRTDPHEARVFAAETGVDSLAVAVGSSHAMRERSMKVDQELIVRLAAAVDVPLVLHGSSSLDDGQLVAAIDSGMAKINISTHVNSLFTAAVRDVLDQDVRLVDPRRYIRAGREAMAAETTRLLTLLG